MFSVRKRQGFTIVELLIVIVVIAILAAIAIVSYNGISDSARRSATEAHLSDLIKAIEVYSIQSGGYPTSISEIDSSNDGDDYAISGVVFCVSATTSTGVTYHRYSNSPNSEEGECSVTEVAPDLAVAPEACFDFDSGNQYIAGYYTNEGNNGANPACPTEFTTPSTIGGVDVTGIGYSAFDGDTYVDRIVLADSITDIYNSAFYNASINYLYIPDSVTSIEGNAFTGSGIVALTVPSSVTNLECVAFYQMPDLVSLSLFADADASTPTMTFGCSDAADNPLLETLTIGSNVTYIGGGAFADNPSLASITILDGDNDLVLTALAFEYAGTVTSLTLPSRTIEISSGALDNMTSLTNLTVAEGGASGLEITSSSFNNTPLQTVSLPSSTTYIGGGAFSGVSTLTSLTITTGGSSPLTITGGAFGGTALTSFAAPSHTELIDSGAFYGITTMTSLTIDGAGSTDMTIGAGAFGETSITSVAIPGRVSTLAAWSFNSAALLETVTFENGVASIENDAFTDTAITAVSIPTATTVGATAFPTGTTITRF